MKGVMMMQVYSQKDDLFGKLVEKTRGVGRRLTFDEVNQDPKMPQANSYAYYYGSFDAAAEEAWRKVRFGDSIVQKQKGVMEVSKRVQMDEERKWLVLQEFVDMYIANDGQMPTARMVKKNQYISEAEVNLLRATGVLMEPKIRRMAEEKTGKKFATAEERRRMKSAVEIVPKPELVIEPQEAGEQEVEKMPAEERAHRGRGHGVTTEEVLADLKALAERLGHVPSQAEIMEGENGANFSYPTYVKKLGPKADWAKVLGMELTEEIHDDELKTIEIPAFSIKIPKALEGKITVTITI